MKYSRTLFQSTEPKPQSLTIKNRRRWLMLRTKPSRHSRICWTIRMARLDLKRSKLPRCVYKWTSSERSMLKLFHSWESRFRSLVIPLWPKCKKLWASMTFTSKLLANDRLWPQPKWVIWIWKSSNANCRIKTTWFSNCVQESKDTVLKTRSLPRSVMNALTRSHHSKLN